MASCLLRLFLGIKLTEIGDTRWQFHANLGEVLLTVTAWSYLIVWAVRNGNH